MSQRFLCEQYLVYFFFAIVAEYQGIIVYFVVEGIVLQFRRDIVATRLVVQQILYRSDILEFAKRFAD